MVDALEVVRADLAVLARKHGFVGGVYMHIGHRRPISELQAELLPLRQEPRQLIASGGIDEGLYRRRGYLDLDPLAARAAAGFTPFAWSVEQLAEADPNGRPVLRALDAWGVRSGMAAPIQDYAAGPAFVTLFRGESVTEFVEEAAAALLLAAARLHAVVRAAPDAQVKGLSHRELEVLRQAAMGRTEQETAASLALSRRGVQFHLARAGEKLDARNKTAAVARAVSAGLISL
ncbi:LuxR C-terminal-related transcriptional regulator [Caulobacter sp. CCNWLY153]|uniref:autoinducer binding domain-containing protein n=1 Tax=unclassified Caulobacter TaxID=2648921 RepID=UPI002FF3A82F